MSIVTGTLLRARLKYPDLDLSKVRLVGWGAGQFFQDFYPCVSEYLNLQYTICPYPENQGKRIHGVEVRAPSALEQESLEHTVIVVMANHFPEVMNQISQLHGRFRTVRAIDFDPGNAALLDEMQDIAELLPSLTMRRDLPSSRMGIFVQGLAFDFTPLVLAWNRSHFPSAYQCMVTWDHQSSELLERCRPWLDELILVPQPENLGLMSRNVILRSARLGVQHLADKGIEFAVRCRSDNILHGSLHQALNGLFSHGRNAGKIAVSLGASWQYMPFHFSEKAMIARTEDMLALWSLPEDPRPADWAADELSDRLELSPERHYQELSQYTFESALWRDYARRLGFPVESLADSYRFAQARLLALEPYMSWYSLKFTALFNLERDTFYSFSAESWNRLFSDSDGALLRAEAASRLAMNSRDFWRGRVG
ncbi:TPA: hypothetical protein RQ911_000724 [Pseudomonas aeruginosa]|uniref:hypothetical protein n=1 Tax=Pseudomonas aeruginosa TaxID=287 RepID=UPI00053E66DD|nr:hypothetical protein [Pseudomonas aeruginosa]MDG3708973.1 WavE lipopolysaccharide synthesis family protein [Pseudomonas aeruginosa]MDG3818013.1 WavE lipopolysaccharide synthesis family protein [Pseudomonas aeruginosa]WCV80455.1 hypothetical protein KKY53_07850 [Pseudomonas aeruginosa]HBO0857340.1 hypothetical protein [Pseudomonas aeruginosa]HBO1237616.1 hypothetical protein [Pseudomonas aeruginosa]